MAKRNVVIQSQSSSMNQCFTTMNAIKKATSEDDKAYYPRTGKRGVPQQFPRKLYEMLEIEAGSYSVDWIATGRGFRITNVEYFSEVVLPKCLRYDVIALCFDALRCAVD